MKKLSLALLLFLFAKPLSAQQGETLLNGFSLVAPFKAAAGTDHNFLIDRPTENSDPAAAPGLSPKRVNDSIMLLTLPKIAYQNDSRRHQFVATWVPEFELFHHNTDQDAINQQALGSFAYSLKRNLQFSLGDTYTASSDPSRVLSNVFVLLPRSRFHENDFRGTIDYQPNQVTSIGIRYDQSYTRFGEAEPLQVRMLDSSIHGYSLLVSRMLAPNKRIRATYSYFKVARLNRGIGDDVDVDTSRRLGRPMHSASLEYRWGVNPNTLLGLSGGLIRLDTGLNYTVRSSIDRRLGNFWIGGGYSRSLSFQTSSPTAFAEGLASGFYDVVSGRFKGQPTRNTAILLETTMARAASSKLIDSTKSLMGRARVDYRVTDRNVLFATFESWQQTKNSYVQSPLSRNRLMMGIEISLSGETERRTNRSNEDTRYVTLTDHPKPPDPEQ